MISQVQTTESGTATCPQDPSGSTIGWVSDLRCSEKIRPLRKSVCFSSGTDWNSFLVSWRTERTGLGLMSLRCTLILFPWAAVLFFCLKKHFNISQLHLFTQTFVLWGFFGRKWASPLALHIKVIRTNILLRYFLPFQIYRLILHLSSMSFTDPEI